MQDVTHLSNKKGGNADLAIFVYQNPANKSGEKPVMSHNASVAAMRSAYQQATLKLSDISKIVCGVHKVTVDDTEQNAKSVDPANHSVDVDEESRDFCQEMGMKQPILLSSIDGQAELSQVLESMLMKR